MQIFSVEVHKTFCHEKSPNFDNPAPQNFLVYSNNYVFKPLYLNCSMQ